MSNKLVFLNCNNPSELKEKGSQRIINAHIGRYHRNRSKPAQKAEGRLERDALISERGPIGHFQELEVKLNSVESNQHGKAASSRIQSTRKNTSYPSNQRKKSRWKSRSPAPSTEEPAQDLPLHRRENDIQYASQTLLKGLTTTSPEVYHDKEEEDEEEKLLDHSAHLPSLDVVRQGRTDPFAVYPVKDDPSQVHALVDFAIQHYWSVICPAEQLGVMNPVNNLYLQDMKVSPLAFHGYCLTIATAYDYLRVQNSQMQVFRPFRARHIQALTHDVRKTLSEMPESPGTDYITDHLLAAVMSLALNSYMKLDSLRIHPVSRFRSPLAKAQYVNHYGQVTLVKAHWYAVTQMVNIRGGIRAINPYCSHLCQSLDLLNSSFTSSNPTFPYHSFMLSLPPPSWPFQLSEDSIEATGLASGFTKLPLSLLNDDNLKRALSTIAQTTNQLEKYYLQGQPKSSWVLLVELRARAQHAALSLASTSSSLHFETDAVTPRFNTASQLTPLKNTSQYLSAIIHHALLIYNNLVLYPMPPHCGIDTHLAISLKQILQLFFESSANDNNEEAAWTNWSDLLLWSLILGGISDHKDTEREWYVSQCGRVLDVLPELRKWLHLEQTLTSFLWLDFVLNEEAIKFWAQCESARFASQSASEEKALESVVQKNNIDSNSPPDSKRGLSAPT